MKPSTLYRKFVIFLSDRLLVNILSILTSPDVGVSIQPIILSIVVFPEPECPAIEIKSPFSIDISIPFTAYTFSFPSG